MWDGEEDQMTAGDDIYQELIAPIEDRMIRSVGRIVRNPDDAADAFQNALLYIWKDLEKIHKHPNPHGYIIRVCVSAAYDVLRKRSKVIKREVAAEYEPTAHDSPEHLASEKELEQDVLRAIASLPRQQAEAVLLRIVDGESFDSIAKALDCSETTARSHVSKGKAKLRELLSYLNPRRVKENEI
jgi:RNA polymerase sigma-70 factor (ECF subfamily)